MTAPGLTYTEARKHREIKMNMGTKKKESPNPYQSRRDIKARHSEANLYPGNGKQERKKESTKRT